MGRLEGAELSGVVRRRVHMNETGFSHYLAAILVADAAGYSRLMSADERATVTALDAARAVFRSQIEARHGRVVDMAGDSVLAVFKTASGAVDAALEVQRELANHAAAAPDNRRLPFRIGIHLGDVIEKADGTVYGDGVNIAARLQTLAEPGRVIVSDAICGAVKGKVNAIFTDLGEQTVKNIADPMRAYALATHEAALAAATGVDISAPVAGFGGRPAIAVLPFANLSGDLEQEYFADGLAEDILTRLALWRWLPVIARNSSFSFKGRAVDVKAVGRALGARYVLEGSVRKAGNRVRMTGQLIDAETGHHLWAERYDRVLEDLFAIQDQLTDGIVGALEGVVGRAEAERAHRKPPGKLDAWDACMLGWWHTWRLTRKDFAIAEPLYRRAAELDPDFALPHVGLAHVRMFESYFRWTDRPADALSEGLASARAGLALDPLDSRAHVTLGLLLAFSAKLDDSLAACQEAIEIDPSSSDGYQCLGVAHAFRGEPEAGLRAIEAAIRLSPNDWNLHFRLSCQSVLLYLARNYAKAAEVAQLAVQRGPQFAPGWRNLAGALGQLGRLDEAREALAQFLVLAPGLCNEQSMRASTAFRDETVFQHFLEGLRKAGWTG
ncbi:MAG: adenylate/guanylate cyclase domain-containing protein [Variovorax sp.]|nr:MAG: adenylate/guanylate cyclase domain-containing protein [Variovorax sp.]